MLAKYWDKILVEFILGNSKQQCLEELYTFDSYLSIFRTIYRTGLY